MKLILPLLFSIVVGFSACSNEGEKLPSFNLTTLNGESITEKDLLGKITIIDVWATWCINCMNERDELNKLAEVYKGDPDVLLLAVSDESPEQLSSFLERKPFNFVQIPHGLELTNAIQTRLVKTTPQHIVLGPDLKIEYEQSGEIANPSKVLGAEIERLKEAKKITN